MLVQQQDLNKTLKNWKSNLKIGKQLTCTFQQRKICILIPFYSCLREKRKNKIKTRRKNILIAIEDALDSGAEIIVKEYFDGIILHPERTLKLEEEKEENE